MPVKCIPQAPLINEGEEVQENKVVPAGAFLLKEDDSIFEPLQYESDS